jgi:CBS domain-containing protein
MDIEKVLRERKIRQLALSPLVTIKSETSLKDAISAMQQNQVGCVLITENHQLVGIFTERDVLGKVMGERVDDSVKIKDFMTPSPLTLNPDSSVLEAIQLMDDHGYRNVPLVNAGGNLVGNLSVSNIIDFLAESFPQEVLSLPPKANQHFSSVDGA